MSRLHKCAICGWPLNAIDDPENKHLATERQLHEWTHRGVVTALGVVRHSRTRKQAIRDLERLIAKQGGRVPEYKRKGFLRMCYGQLVRNIINDLKELQRL